MSRLLHLYALSRMLAEPAFSFRVSEDIEIFDQRGNLIEAVYDETSPGFLTRMRRRLRDHPKATQRVLGTEPISRATLERDGFSHKQVDALRERLVTEDVHIEESPGFPQLSAWLEREPDRVSAADVRERVRVIEEASRMDPVTAARALAHVGIPSELHVTAGLGWIDRVDELRRIPHVRVRVTADEAAWRRAEQSGVTLLWKNVDVTVEPRPHAEPETWSEAASTLYELLHRDVRRYIEEHGALIADVLEQTKSPELAWAALDPAGTGLLDHADELFPDIVARRPKEAFAASRAWLSAQTQEWREPHWRAVAEIAFWSKRWNLPAREPDAAQFRRETRTASIVDDGETVTAHWLPPVEIDYDPYRELMHVVDGIRRLHPARARFAANLHGRPPASFGPNELSSPWLYWVHLLFLRPEITWDEYAAQVAALRGRVTALFARITVALTAWFRRDKPFNIFQAGVSADEWDALAAQLLALPKVPRTADAAEGTYVLSNAIEAWADAVRDFLGHSWRFFVANPQIGRGEPEGRARVENWLAEQGITREEPTRRLADAIRLLKPMQEEFAARFPGLVDEADERERTWDLWAVWYDFAFYPRRRLANAVRDSKAAIEARIDERRRTLRKRFRELQLGEVEIVSERDGLWLTVDTGHVPNVINAFAEALVQVIDVLHPPVEPHSFDRYVLDLVWPKVHMVPLVRGKSLTRLFWSLDIDQLPRPGEDLGPHAWKFVQKRIPREAWDRLGLEAWPSNVATGGRRLGPETIALRELLEQLLLIREIPDADPAVTVPYWEEVARAAERRAGEVLELLAELPPDIFSTMNSAVENASERLLELMRNVRALVVAADPLAFDDIAEGQKPVVETVVPILTAIAETWTDRELPHA